MKCLCPLHSPKFSQALAHSVTLFRDGASKEVMKVK